MSSGRENWRNSVKSAVVMVAASVAVLAIILIGSVFSFDKELESIVFKRSYQNIMQAAELQKMTFSNHLNNQFSALSRVAAFIGSIDEMNQEELTRVLKSEVKTNSFITVGFADRSGNIYTSEGTLTHITNPYYYARVIGGERMISDPVLAPDGNYYCDIMLPVYAQEAIVGVLYGTYPTKALSAALAGNYLGAVSGSLVVTPLGDVITTSGKLGLEVGQQNMFSAIEALNLPEQTLTQIREDVAQKKSGFFSANSSDGLWYVVYQPMGISNWVLLTTVAEKTANGEAAVISKGVADFAMRIALVFVMLTIILMARTLRSENLIERAMHRVQKANREYEVLIENIRGGVFTINCTPDMRVLFASAGFERLTGYNSIKLDERFSGSFLGLVEAEDRKLLSAVFKDTCLRKSIGSCEYRIVCHDGIIKWMLMNWSVVESSTGQLSAHCVLTDITKNREERERLKLAQERYKIVLGQTDSLILEYNFTDNTYYTNSADQTLFGYDLSGDWLIAELISRDIVFGEDAETFRDMFNRLAGGEKQVEVFVRFNVRNAGVRWHRLTFSGIADSSHKVIRAIGRITDVDTQKRETDLLRERAIRDALTGAYNKTSTVTMIDRALSETTHSFCHAMLVMDIDNFKSVNDRLGHLMGDDLLFEFSKIIKNNIRADDIFGRVGGDEFVVLLRNFESHEQAVKRVRTFWQSINKFSLPSNPEVEIGVSVGAAVSPEDGMSYQALFENADRTLLDVKAASKGTLEFSTKQDSEG